MNIAVEKKRLMRDLYRHHQEATSLAKQLREQAARVLANIDLHSDYDDTDTMAHLLRATMMVKATSTEVIAAPNETPLLVHLMLIIMAVLKNDLEVPDVDALTVAESLAELLVTEFSDCNIFDALTGYEPNCAQVITYSSIVALLN
jgi:hypothetical protein